MDDDVDTLQEPDIDFHDWIAKHRGRIIDYIDTQKSAVLNWFGWDKNGRNFDRKPLFYG